MEHVRIGLIGAGVIGQTHSAVLRAIANLIAPKVTLVAVADPDAAHRSQTAEIYGYTQQFDSSRELLDSADIDAVFICTPTACHAEQVHQAAERGLAIFCEKPLAMSFAEGNAMIEAITRSRRQSQIGLVLRFSAVYQVMRDLLRNPLAGKPLAVVFRDDQCFPIRGVHSSAWRADPRQTAGGTLIEHGVHDLDIMTWLFGPIARLRAWERNYAGHQGIEDFMSIELEFDSGLRAQHLSLWHNMVQRPSNRRLEVFCENAFVASEADMLGSIDYQLGDGPLITIDEEEVMQRFLALQADVPPALHAYFRVPYLVEDYRFLDALLHDRPTDPDMTIGLEAQRIAAAVYHAARSGQEVDVARFRPSED